MHVLTFTKVSACFPVLAFIYYNLPEETVPGLFTSPTDGTDTETHLYLLVKQHKGTFAIFSSAGPSISTEVTLTTL